MTIKRGFTPEQLEAGRKKQAEMRAAGLLVYRNPLQRSQANPQSKLKGLIAKVWDINPACVDDYRPKSEDAWAFARKCAADIDNGRTVRHAQLNKRLASGGRAITDAIEAVCLWCECAQIDPGGPARIRDCTIKQCGLWPHRPFRQLVGRGRKNVTNPQQIEPKPSRKARKPRPTTDPAPI